MCIFCSIVAGDIPCYRVYEDETVIAFLDLSQTTKGHCLVVCKDHYETLLDIPTELAAHMMEVVQQLTPRILRATGATGFNILNNGNPVAGQSVMHAHIHIIPRYGDQDDIRIEMKENPDAIDLEALQHLIETA